MPERSSLTQGVQVGIETVPGTNVAANKKFVSIGITPAVQMDPMEFRPMGSKYNTIVTPGKEWVEADIEGIGSYTELLWFFSSLIAAPGAPTTVDTSARKWAFESASSAEDTVKTMTVEQGGVVRAHKFNYGLVSELELTFNRDGVEVGGAMIGQRISDNITLTVTPTTPPQLPILPTDLDVWLDATSAGLGTTKLLRVLEATWTLGDRFNPVWVLNSTLPSFAAHVESEPNAQLKLLMEADAEGMTQLTQMRAGTTKYIRIKGTSPTLAGAVTEPYSLMIDSACKVAEVGDFSDEDGVYAIEWTFDIVHDGSWGTGKAFHIDLVNKETTL
jgi:hypothetical protein